MGSELAIRVEGLGKRYRLGSMRQAYSLLSESIGEFVRGRLLGHKVERAEASPEELWALRDVSFEVRRGEVLGVIGRNGAGKSTLLKVLSRITTPTTGRVEINGRVGSLLEVGTGFHPELTGRENIYLNGSILGMSKAEIDAKFDEIVEFAEISRFIDTPVKRYSSGMHVRLGFAVAAHLQPEILLVDEVLAVGDFAFQSKCLGKMGEVAKGGRTVLFVSHNMVAVQGLCSRVIALKEGRLVSDGPPSEVVHEYFAEHVIYARERSWRDPREAPGSEEVKLMSARIRPRNSGIDQFDIETELILDFEYLNTRPGLFLNLSVHLFNEQGILIFNTTTINEPIWFGRPHPVGRFRSEFSIPANLLNIGVHRLQLLFVKDQGKVLSRHDELLIFDIKDALSRRGSWHGKWPGVVRPELKWTTELIEEA